MALDCGPRGHRFDLAKGGLSQGRRRGGRAWENMLSVFFQKI